MKRLLFILLFMPFVHVAQDYSALWKGHFSYYNIKDVAQSSNKLYAAAENAVFIYNIDTEEIEELSTINGLSGETISTIYYSEVYELLMIGYENGLIEIVFDGDDQVLSVVDIVDKATIPQTSKKINHFNAQDNVVYIATNYGVSVFNLDRLEFGDTYFIGASGTQIQVRQTAVFQGYIYAATIGNGIKKGAVSNPNLIDYNNWETIGSGSFIATEAQGDMLYAVNLNRHIYQVSSANTLTSLNQFPSVPTDVRVVNNKLLITINNTVYVYNEGFSLLSQIPVSTEFNTSYIAATLISNSVFIGTQTLGVLKTELSNPTVFEEIHPTGPLLNTPFSIQAEPTGVWVTFGEYTTRFDPNTYGGPHKRGISHLKGEEWTNIPYEDVLTARSLNDININPKNTNQVFISSLFDGLLEVNDTIPSFIYNTTNSDLERVLYSTKPLDIRACASAFDTNGVLWITQGHVDHQLKSFNIATGQWQIYALSSIIPEAANNAGFADVIIDNNQTKWLASDSFGVIAFNENGGNPLTKAIYTEEDNMPNKRSSAIALDKRNQLWIGTHRGLRVLYNTIDFFENDNAKANEIIIEENGVASELLYEQFISDIKVDGANNKWIGTTDSGLFYVSQNGQKTIYHFTTDNSPLPSNTIKDISINETNGTVYIATVRGLVSFRSGSSGTGETLSKTYAYPNPVRPHFNMAESKVKIKDLSENVNIKITDIEGNLVAEAQSNVNQRHSGYNLEIDGGTAYWNGKNLAQKTVSSGVYLVLIADLDTYETKALKLMVIR
ncbi:MAG: ABC transporter substrate-binding protein [Flavobacteriaceae bacterium]